MTSMHAFIEFDDSGCNEPFGQYDAESLSLDSLAIDKEYPFFAAIAGVRNEGTTPPLYAPRGLPSRLSCWARHGLLESTGKPDGVSAGWLYLREIKEAIQHMGVREEQIGIIPKVWMDIMESFEQRLGADRARLVFTFD